MTFFPQFMYEQFQTFVLLSGAFLAAICGVALADYFVLRRQRMDLREIHLAQRGTLYRYPGGVNAAGVVAVLAATGLYLWLYNPITLETQPAFLFLTASLPTVIVGGLVYLGLTALLYRGRRHLPEGAAR